MSDSYPSLGIKVDFAEIRRLIGGLKEVQAEYAKTGQAAAAAGSRAGAGALGGAAAATAARATVTALSGLQTAMNATGAAMHGFWSVLHRIRTTFFDVRTAIGLMIGGMVVGPIFKMADAMTTLEARSRLYAVSGAQVPSIMVRLFQTAQDARAPLEGIAKLYTRLAPLSEQLGRSQGDLIRIVETVAKAFTLGGASAAEATSSAQQFAQAISSNRFGGDELRSVAENAPALLQAIAEGVNQINPALNLNAATFIKWAQAGNATSAIMVQALENSRGKIEAMFASMPVTIDQSMTLMTNSITKAVGDIDKAFAASNGGVKLSTEIALSVSKLAQFISSSQFTKGAAEAMTFLGNAMHFVGDAAKFALNGITALAGGFAILLTIRAVTSAYLLFTSTIGGATAAQFLMANAQNVLRNGMIALTGTAGGLGIALTAATAGLTLLVGALMYAMNVTKSGEDAMRSYTGAVANGTQAIINAITVATAYGQNVTGLTGDLHMMAGAQQTSNEKIDQGTQLARDMAEVQRQMAIAQLEATSATFASIVADTAKAASMKRLFATVIDGFAQVMKIPAPFLNFLGSGSFGGGDIGSNVVSNLQGVAADLRADAAALDGASGRAAQSYVTAQTAISRLRSMTFNPVSVDGGGSIRPPGSPASGGGSGSDAENKRNIEAAEKMVALAEDAALAEGDRVSIMVAYRRERETTLRLAGMSTTAAESEARVLEKIAMLQEERNGLTDQEIAKRARLMAGMEEEEDKAAKLKRDMKDSIERAFVDTGKLDFRSIREGITKSIREAVYDALLAKPIQIVVDAVVDVTTKGINKILDKLLGAKDAEGNRQGGWLKTAMEKLPDGIQKALSKGMTIAKDAFVGGQIGATAADMVGLKGSNKGGGKGQGYLDAAGSLIGSFFGGPIGAAIGTFVARLIGPALLGKESNYAAVANFRNGGTAYSLSGSKRTTETTAAVTGIAESVMGVIKTLATIGIQSGDVIKNIDIGTRDPTHIRLANGQDVRSAVGDPEAALKAASLALLQYGQYQDVRMKALVDQMIAANSSFDAIVAKLDLYVQAQKVPKDLQTALLQYSNPRAYQMKLLQDQQIERRKTIQGYAASGFYTPDQLASINSNLTALERSEITNVVEQFASNLTDAAHSLKDFKVAQEDIAKFTRKLMTGSLSPLSQQDQLSLDRQSYISTLARAQGGNYNALTGITEDAQAYLTAAQKFFGSTQAYTDIFTEVTDALNVLASSDIQDPMVSAIEQGTLDLTAALEAQTLALIAAIQAANNNTVDGLVTLGDAVVTTNGGGLADIADSLTDQNLYNVALNGGIAA